MSRYSVVFSFLLTLAACADSNSPAVSDIGRSETGEATLHAVHDEKLHNLMSRMNSVMMERFLTEPELDAERRKYAQRMAKNAHELLQTLDAVLATSTTLPLNEAEKSIFQALAKKLSKQAQTLQEQAQQNRMADISATLEEMSVTCSSCHKLYRKQ